MTDGTLSDTPLPISQPVHSGSGIAGGGRCPAQSRIPAEADPFVPFAAGLDVRRT